MEGSHTFLVYRFDTLYLAIYVHFTLPRICWDNTLFSKCYNIKKKKKKNEINMKSIC